MSVRRVVAALATTAALTLAASPSFAQSAGAPDRQWSAGHGAGSVSGTTTFGAGTGFGFQRVPYTLNGSLTHRGEGCSSAWVQFFMFSAPVKVAQTCGSTTTAFTHSGMSDRTSGARLFTSIRVCEGTTTEDCGRFVVVD